MTKHLKSDRKEYRTQTQPRKTWRSYLANCALATIVTGLGLIFVFGFLLIKAYKIPTDSMKPSILIGDHIIALKLWDDQKLRRGDIIIFPLPTDKKKSFIKRVIGLPGEKLEIRQQQVYINDRHLNEPYALHTIPPTTKSALSRDNFGPLAIPNGYVFVLGDNRENSFDSRMFGPLEIREIERKVKIIYWSWSHEDEAVRWKRIGTIPE